MITWPERQRQMDAERVAAAIRGDLRPTVTRPRSSAPRAHIIDPARRRPTGLCGQGPGTSETPFVPLPPGHGLPTCGLCEKARDRITILAGRTILDRLHEAALSAVTPEQIEAVTQRILAFSAAMLPTAYRGLWEDRLSVVGEEGTVTTWHWVNTTSNGHLCAGPIWGDEVGVGTLHEDLEDRMPDCAECINDEFSRVAAVSGLEG